MPDGQSISQEDQIVLDRLLSKIEINQQSDCWLWTGCTGSGGYAVIQINRKTRYGIRGTRYAHRVAYEMLVGSIPRGHQLDHLCRIRRCVNPDHLEPVTPKENTRRGINANSLKTICPQGHSYSVENTYIARDGSRICRACHKEHERVYRATKRK